MQLGKGKLAGVEDALIEDGRYAYTLICKSASAYLLSIPVHVYIYIYIYIWSRNF